MAITEATIHVVKIKITALCHLALIPKYCAFSSPSDKITICRCNRHNISNGINPLNNETHILSAVIAARLPIVQNSIVANCPKGSAIYLNIIIPASAKEEITIPANM